jgi:hypothetical protein
LKWSAATIKRLTTNHAANTEKRILITNSRNINTV